MAHLIIGVLVRMKLHGQSVVGFLDCCLYKRNRVRPCHKRMSNGPLAIILVPARLPSRRQAPAAAGTCVLYVCLLGMGQGALSMHEATEGCAGRGAECGAPYRATGRPVSPCLSR